MTEKELSNEELVKVLKELRKIFKAETPVKVKKSPTLSSLFETYNHFVNDTWGSVIRRVDDTLKAELIWRVVTDKFKPIPTPCEHKCGDVG